MIRLRNRNESFAWSVNFDICHPVIVVFTPQKIIVVTTETDKLYFVIEQPDLRFAELTYKKKN